MSDISGVGLQILVKASNTYPVGVTLTEFADDTDPLDIPNLVIGETGSALNGTQLSWSKPDSVITTVALVPESEDDVAMRILLNANRTSKNKRSVKDDIDLIISYPSGRTVTLLGGKITEGTPVPSVQSSGRLKTPVYIFKFENYVEA